MTDMTTGGDHVLGGRYELGEEIGRGGMASVRRGLDTRLNRPIAVKLLRPDLARDPSFQARFRREAQSAASLNAANVVAVYDTGEDTIDGARVPYIVMEYVEGQTLRQLLRSGRRLMPERALEITDGVLAALEYSHRQGIVHRDVKPANVMMTPNGSIKVMDFGIARAITDTSATMTQTANVLGTAQYLSPEQAKGEKVDARSDVYSTGCLLYELLTNRPPFVGESPVSVAYQHVRETPIPPSRLDPEVTASIDAIVMKALAKNPDNRYQSATEMRADIERARQGLPVTAPTVMADLETQSLPAARTAMIPLVPATPRSAHRGRWYVALTLATLVALAVLGFAAYALFGGNQNKVRIPNLVGLSLGQAKTALTNQGLTLGSTTPQKSTQPKNTVLAQNPPASAELASGGAVDLTVSSGPQQVAVPPLVGLSQSDAVGALKDARLQLGSVSPKDSRKPAGQVLASRPGSGTSVDEGSPVDLVVSTGQVPVPSVIGLTQSEAEKSLNRAGFFNIEVSTAPSDATQDGTVISQFPAPHALQKVSDPVRITVGQFTASPPPSSSPPTPSGTPSPSTT